MSKANELTTAILDHLYRNGAFGWRSESAGVFDQRLGLYRTSPKRGVSDILAMLPPNGRLLACEVKVGKDRLSPEQTGFLANIKHYGGLTFVAKDFESFKEWFKHILDEQKMVS